MQIYYVSVQCLFWLILRPSAPFSILFDLVRIPIQTAAHGWEEWTITFSPLYLVSPTLNFAESFDKFLAFHLCLKRHLSGWVRAWSFARLTFLTNTPSIITFNLTFTECKFKIWISLWKDEQKSKCWTVLTVSKNKIFNNSLACVVLDGETNVRTTDSMKRKFETFCAAQPTSNSSSSSDKSKKALKK